MTTTEQIANYNTASPTNSGDWLLSQQGPSGTSYTKTTPAAIVQTVSKFYAYDSGGTSISAGSSGRINISKVLFDTNSLFNLSDRGFVIQASGYYQINGSVSVASEPTAGDQIYSYLAINGVAVLQGSAGTVANTSVNAYASSSIAGILLLEAGNILTLWAYSDGTATTDYANGQAAVFLSGIGPF